MRNHITILALVLCLSLVGCGGSLTSVTDSISGKRVTVSVPQSYDSILADDSIEIKATVSCFAPDLFYNECLVDNASLSWDSESGTITHNFAVYDKLKHGESKVYPFKLFQLAERSLAPFSYLYDINPTSVGFISRSEVLGMPKSAQVGTITQTCVTQDKTTTCTTDTSYAGNIPSDAVSGTLQITDGKLKLSETVFGYLSGDGVGSVANGSYGLTFTSTPATLGAPLMANYLSSLAPLSENSFSGDINVVYGDLKLTQNGNLLQDSTGQTYGLIANKGVTPLLAWGFSNSPVVATYTGGTCSICGGEIAGKGDGINTAFKVKTKYAPIDPTKVRVFTLDQPATLLVTDYIKGELTALFGTPPSAGQDIKVSYVVTEYSVPLSIHIGGINAQTSIRIKKQ